MLVMVGRRMVKMMINTMLAACTIVHREEKNGDAGDDIV